MSARSSQFRVFEGWSLPVMVLDAELRFIFANDAYLNAVHRNFADLEDVYVFDAFKDTPERVEPILSKFQATLNGDVTQLDAQPFQLEMEDGRVEELFWRATQDPLFDDKNNIVGVIQRCEDITHQHQLEQRNKAIGYELSHRVKNIMAVVSSVARITGRNASRGTDFTVHDFIKTFTSRLNAMSRTNDLLEQADWSGLDVRAIFLDELSPFEDSGNHVYSLQGPHIRLSVDASKDLSMVCHELMTNAVKYGSLGQDDGHLDVHWTRSGDRLVIKWTEQCLEVHPPSDSVGFGTQLFDMLPYVTVDRNFTPTGLHLTITMDGEKVFA